MMLNFKFCIALVLVSVSQVMLFALTGHGSEKVAQGRAPILCYKCSSLDEKSYCSDPFNDTQSNIELESCNEYCVKWKRTTLTGKMYYERTCSDQLYINMRKSTVCIQESRPSNGTLCFCDKDKCNTASHTYVQFDTSLLCILLHVIFVY